MDGKFKKKSRSKPSKPRFIFEEHNQFIKREPVTEEKLIVYPIIDIDVVKDELNVPEQSNSNFSVETNLNLPVENQVKVLNTFAPGTSGITKHYTLTTNETNETSIVPQLMEGNSNDIQNVDIKTEPTESFVFVDIKENSVKIEPIKDSAIKIESEGDVTLPLATVNLENSKDSYLTNCDYCEFKAKDVLQLVAHIHNSHFKSNYNQNGNVRELKNGYLACDYCEFQTSRQHCLVMHITAKHMPKTIKPKKIKPLKYTCDFCDERFSTKLQTLEHIKTHDGKNLSCECSHEYWDHKGHQVSKFSCNLCKHRSCSKILLHQHIVKVHSMKSLTFKCNNCHSSFSEKNNLVAHLKAQAGKQSGFKCSSINSKKNNRYNDFTFDYDMYIISKGKKSSTIQHECTKCPFKCTQKRHLKMNMDSHNNAKEKAYTCRFCKFKYSTHVGLDRHMMKIHPHERPYFCKLCDCKYSLMNDLVKHIKSHFGRT